MTTQIYAYINLKGNCREAMTFYKDCIGGELFIQNVEGTPMESQCPPEMKNQVLHANLKKGDLILMASDMIGSDGLMQGNNFSLSVNCSSEAEASDFFTKLSSEGKISHPLKAMFWGDLFGSFTDKFNINWMINFTPKK